MPVNPETTVRKLVSLPRQMVQAIEDFRFAGRIKTESEAIRRLIEIGLAANGPDATKPAPLPPQKTIGPEDEDRSGPEAPTDDR